MCIIVYKPSNITFPSKDILRECFDNNPDGCGYMFAHNNNIKIHKGFMKFKTFYKSLSKDRKRYGDNLPFILHFRISTAGGIKPELTHPYPITDSYNHMRNTYQYLETKEWAFAHNGILSDYNPDFSEYNINDTMKFNKMILSPLVNSISSNYVKNLSSLNEYIPELLGNIIGNSNKLAILSPNGNVMLVNEHKFICDNGIYYSNSTYKPYTYDYSKYLSDETTYYDCPPNDCKAMITGNWSYCDKCPNYHNCYGYDDNKTYNKTNCDYHVILTNQYSTYEDTIIDEIFDFESDANDYYNLLMDKLTYNDEFYQTLDLIKTYDDSNYITILKTVTAYEKENVI